MGCADGSILEDSAQEACDPLFVVGSWPARLGFAVEPGQSLLEPYLAPVADRRVRDAETVCDRRVRLARGRRKDDLCPSPKAMRGGLRSSETIKFVTLDITERKARAALKSSVG